MVSLLDSTTREMLLVPMPAGELFFIRRKPDPLYPDDAYVLLLTIAPSDGTGPSMLRPVERGNYAWALRKTRELRIPEKNIEHNDTPVDGIDDGYEGWHLNARIVRGA